MKNIVSGFLICLLVVWVGLVIGTKIDTTLDCRRWGYEHARSWDGTYWCVSGDNVRWYWDLHVEEKRQKLEIDTEGIPQ